MALTFTSALYTVVYFCPEYECFPVCFPLCAPAELLPLNVFLQWREVCAFVLSCFVCCISVWHLFLCTKIGNHGSVNSSVEAVFDCFCKINSVSLWTLQSLSLLWNVDRIWSSEYKHFLIKNRSVLYFLNTYYYFSRFSLFLRCMKAHGFLCLSPVYLLTCIIKRGQWLELSRKGGMWGGREWEWSGRRGSGQCDCVCGSQSTVTECCVHTWGLRAGTDSNSTRR